MPEPLTLQEISDRFLIGDLLTRYAHAVDSGELDLFDTVFTPDALIDLSASGGTKGTRDEVKAWLADTLESWPGRQHLLGLPSVTVSGDTAEVRAPFTDTLSTSRDFVAANAPGLIKGGGVYHHRLIRTPEGWRSTGVTLEQLWRTL